MNRELRAVVRRRARRRCEYCLLHELDLPLYPFHVEHIIAIKHHGEEEPDNLCWSCLYCNLAKSSNIGGIDPATGNITALFHPRRQAWSRHFLLNGPTIIGRTAAGRVTIYVLNMNAAHRIELRRLLLEHSLYPR
ncbi:MAG: HNH endonuclease signature motif containing protein [Gemmatales bacterium]